MYSESKLKKIFSSYDNAVQPVLFSSFQWFKDPLYYPIWDTCTNIVNIPLYNPAPYLPFTGKLCGEQFSVLLYTY